MQPVENLIAPQKPSHPASAAVRETNELETALAMA